MSGLDVVKHMGGVVACKAVDTVLDTAEIVLSNPGMLKDVALNAVKEGTDDVAIEALKGAMKEGTEEIAIEVLKDGVKEGTEEVAKKQGLEALQYIFEPLKDSPIGAAGAITVVCEGIPFVMDSSEAVYKLFHGAINGKDCAKVVAKSGTKAVCSGAGSMLGASIGQMVIPMPFVGAVVGGTVGSLLGRCTARGMW